ncbi:MAG: GlsB/YeaQ/YmgE family stress response rane protein [Candidatus Saccharibacteria bacterium]|nr:GlsB/YeaQ/YmgE family stress response rane protein [Candidatus Saccharibacteria bacterium]
MSIIVMIILGGLVGLIASRLMSRDSGVLGSIIIGIVGSFIGSFIARLITGADKSYLAFDWTGLFWSLVGSIILVAILNATTSNRHHTV